MDHLLVFLHGPKSGEGLAAHVTSEGFLTSVDHFVPLQDSRSVKGLTTHITNKGLITSVGPFVLRQATR